jgi:surface polysaccharide O-acyltransferase-like enzyme
MILSSISFFLLLNTFKAPDQQANAKYPWVKRLMATISATTLGIYLFHMMIIYTLQNGLLGITLNGNTVNSIIGVPLMVAVVLLVCLVVLVPLKKVPYLKRLIG